MKRFMQESCPWTIRRSEFEKKFLRDERSINGKQPYRKGFLNARNDAILAD